MIKIQIIYRVSQFHKQIPGNNLSTHMRKCSKGFLYLMVCTKDLECYPVWACVWGCAEGEVYILNENTEQKLSDDNFLFHAALQWTVGNSSIWFLTCFLADLVTQIKSFPLLPFQDMSTLNYLITIFPEHMSELPIFNMITRAGLPLINVSPHPTTIINAEVMYLEPIKNVFKNPSLENIPSLISRRSPQITFSSFLLRVVCPLPH